MLVSNSLTSALPASDGNSLAPLPPPASRPNAVIANTETDGAIEFGEKANGNSGLVRSSLSGKSESFLQQFLKMLEHAGVANGNVKSPSAASGTMPANTGSRPVAATGNIGITDTNNTHVGAKPTSVAGATPTDSATPTAPATPTEAAAPAAPAEKTETVTDIKPSAEAVFLDNSKFSSPEELKKFEPLVAHLPPEEREQAEKELNRPIAAAKMAAEGGDDGEKAKAFIDANPALKTATDIGKHGGKTDGVTIKDDYTSFAKNMENARDSAVQDINNYKKDNPNADPQSLQMVNNAALLRANEHLVKCADPKTAASGDQKVDVHITEEALKNLTAESNPGFASILMAAAGAFSGKGFFDAIDQGGMAGKDLAKTGADGKVSGANISDWIKKQAPTNGGEFATMMSSAATLNAVSNTDISKLDKDVFEHPQNYSGEQKAAVMVKLQRTQESMKAGKDLHKVDKTVDALQEKIGQLQSDPDVQGFLNKAIPEQQRIMIAKDPALDKAVKDRARSVASGDSLEADMQAAHDAATKDKDGKPLKDPKAPDYSNALANLDAELQLQRDLQGEGANVPQSADVVGKRDELSKELKSSYQRNFVEAGKLNEGLKEKNSDAKQVLAVVDTQKAIYENALPPEVTSASQNAYIDATMGALKGTKSGVAMIKDYKAATGQVTSESKALGGKEILGAGAGAALGISGLVSVSSLLANGQKVDAAKAITDGVRGSSTAARVGYDMATKSTHTAGEIAGKVAGRVVGAIAGRVAGAAAAQLVAAAIPVIGWAIDAAMGLGFAIKAIIDAVHKKNDQKAFDHNVDPTLDQFGIPRAH